MNEVGLLDFGDGFGASGIWKITGAKSTNSRVPNGRKLVKANSRLPLACCDSHSGSVFHISAMGSIGVGEARASVLCGPCLLGLAP